MFIDAYIWHQTNDLRLSLRDWEMLKYSRLEKPSTQDSAHVTTAKTKFYKEQKKTKYYGLRKKIEWPLTGSFTANLYLDSKFWL